MAEKALMILLSFLGCFILAGVLSGILIKLTNVSILDIQSIMPDMKKEILVIKVQQLISMVCIFILPALTIPKILKQPTISYLKLDKSPNYRYYIIVILIMTACIPIMNLIINWNESIVFPEQIESILRASENRNQHTMKLILSNTSLSALFLNIFIVAIIPAFGEELIFRAVILNFFIKQIKNIHIAIFVSAFMFSFIHFQFYGFVPRLLLGMLFGYLVCQTSSLWPAIFAHFFNNFIAILATLIN